MPLSGSSRDFEFMTPTPEHRMGQFSGASSLEAKSRFPAFPVLLPLVLLLISLPALHRCPSINHCTRHDPRQGHGQFGPHARMPDLESEAGWEDVRLSFVLLPCACARKQANRASSFEPNNTRRHRPSRMLFFSVFIPTCVNS